VPPAPSIAGPFFIPAPVKEYTLAPFILLLLPFHPIPLRSLRCQNDRLFSD
jgi:hypothetical protein